MRSLRRAVLARRRPLAALLVALAVLAGLRTTVGPGPATVAVPVARHDLVTGHRVGAEDVTIARWPAELAPGGLDDSVTGQVLAAPLRAGEPITDVRLVGTDLARAHPDLTVTPLRLPDPAVVDLLEVGDLIDLAAIDPESGESRPVARGVRVLAIPPPTTDQSGLTGRVVVIGVSPHEADDVTAATIREFLAVTYTR